MRFGKKLKMYQQIKVINTITNVLLAGTILSFGFVSASVIKQKFMPSSEPAVVIERIEDGGIIADNNVSVADETSTPVTADETQKQDQDIDMDSQEDSTIDTSADVTAEAEADNSTNLFPLTAERVDSENEELPASSETEEEINNSGSENGALIEEISPAENTETQEDAAVEETLASILEQQVSENTEDPSQEESDNPNLIAGAGNKQVEDVLDVDPAKALYALSEDYIALPGSYEEILPVPVQENSSDMSNSGYVVLSELTRASILAGYCVTSNGHEGFALNLQKLVGRESFTKHEKELMEYENVGEPILEKYDQIIAKNYPTIQSQKKLCQAALDAEIVVRSFIPGI